MVCAPSVCPLPAVTAVSPPRRQRRTEPTGHLHAAPKTHPASKTTKTAAAAAAAGSSATKFTLSPAELAAVLGRNDSTAVQYVSRPKGSMLVCLAGHHFEFVCNKAGAHYYRCLEHKATQYGGCEARVLVKGLRVFAIRAEHSHAVVPMTK